ncbi:LuxR family transcriptional regulator [Cryptosporangium minutisporangium]|uniref:HTH luxR-type domain-containing protein n=1 Tax=Cryptosporangium minutisporangium TaxID=113569 RepID=A0ABP6TA70_9ACTN
MTGRPLYVLRTAADLAVVVRRLAAEGWAVRTGLSVPDEPWDLTATRTVVTGPVADDDAVAGAVLAAARGAGVVAVADAESTTGQALLADLARIGPVRRAPRTSDTNGPAAARTEPDAGGSGDGLPLTDEQRALLDRLAAGDSIAAAAAAEFLSLRTANRRIAAAREALGVRTTRQAVIEYVRARR